MATVTAIYRVPDGLTGGLSVQDTAGFTATHVYQVEFDDFNSSIVAAITASNSGSIPSDEVSRIPFYGESNEEDPRSRVIQKTGEPVDGDASVWRVTVSYAYPQINAEAPGSPPAPSDPETGAGSEGGGSGGGGAIPAVIPTQQRSRGSWSRQKAWEKDRNGLLVKNSAGDPFDPPITTEENLAEWTFVRSQTSVSEVWFDDFANAVNAFPFTIGDQEYDADTLRVSKLTYNEIPATENTPVYYQVTIVISQDPLGWNPAPLDRGFRKLVDGERRKIIDKGSGMPVATPALLDGTGGELAVGGTPVYLDGEAPSTFGPFILHKRMDFDWLALDC
ncbi:MAG TPA: hypothetical protein VEA69_21230 [Tepidisphaeraceae bacterium]|nr:hypothetical protein [Tepidisphaeraceae bacterium]